MEQLDLDLGTYGLKQRTDRTTLIVDTLPPHLHKKSVLDLGLSIVADTLDADVCHWRDTVENIEQYDTIGFSVIYVMYVLNIVPFLRRHNIEPYKHTRKEPLVIIGGQGASNLNGILDPIGDIFRGEIEGNEFENDRSDRKVWTWCSELKSEPLWDSNRSVVEISRGCKYGCRFCEYGHVTGGRYREKSLNLIKDQLLQCMTFSTKRITLRSANLAGHTDLDELLEFCVQHGIYQGWTDISLKDADKIMHWLKPLNITAPKIGVESFDESTRKNVCGSAKNFSDDYLEEVIAKLMENCNLIHLYLIYGLPDDDYRQWYRWVHKLSRMRDSFSHNIRIDFSITNFNPCRGTPLAGADVVDFRAKERFIKRWIEVLKGVGFYKPTATMGRGSDYGRHGRKELTYKLLMTLRHGESNLTPKIVDALPYGIGRSVSDRHALQFLEYDSSMSSG